jgi:hypothetical protein
MKDNNEYDVIVPMGSSCVMAIQLRSRNLRQSSFPFDWLLFQDSTNCKTIETLITSHFEDFLALEHLRLDETLKRDGRYSVTHQRYPITFLHDFLSPTLTPETLAPVQEKYQRRIDRFYHVMETASSVCLTISIRQDVEPFNCEHLKHLYATVQQQFPNLKTIDMFVVIFNEAQHLFETIPMEKGELHINHITRAITPYDTQVRVFDFAWLDLVRLSQTFIPQTAKGSVSRKMSVWERYHYKLYRHLYRWLERRGLIHSIF